MIRIAISTALAAALAMPAMAQSTVTEYYVVQDVSTKRCTIVDIARSYQAARNIQD